MSALNEHRTGSMDVAELLLPQGERPVEFRAAPRPELLTAGRLEAFDEAGRPLVRVDHALQPALTTVPLSQHDLGRDVVLSTVSMSGQLQPVILGLLQQPTPVPATQSTNWRDLELVSDGRRAVVSAEDEVTLRCGKASITLTKNGKVLIRGDYILSRSTGVNRVKGGSVQIN
jgi:hypothetical protein